SLTGRPAFLFTKLSHPTAGSEGKDSSFRIEAVTALHFVSNTSSSLENLATTPLNQIQETISDNCVVIFSKTSCSYCTMAKKLFHDMNVNYKVVELDLLEYGNQFQDALYKMTGERTVPRIFVNGTFIGGATDTYRLHKEGKLLPLVHQCYLKKSKRKEFQ
uniref:Glutaredoxin-2, mitochondrial n=1 Tax=Mandrillus leucophaeus TaxID=9568 RepID=A0A2K5ZCQ9_MANLE